MLAESRGQSKICYVKIGHCGCEARAGLGQCANKARKFSARRLSTKSLVISCLESASTGNAS